MEKLQDGEIGKMEKICKMRKMGKLEDGEIGKCKKFVKCRK